MSRRTVLVTGANGYIGNAVAKEFNRAGWKTYGLIRRAEDASDLEQHEIHAIISSPKEVISANLIPDDLTFDVIVSNTEDWSDYITHFNDVKKMLVHLGQQSLDKTGIRPLVLLSSGCKDYGMTGYHGDPDLAPHTESSPLTAFPILLPRTNSAANLMEESRQPDTSLPFDVTVLRPTNVYGYGSSYYGALFAFASKSQERGGILRIEAEPENIMHSAHVDDCATAYVALAEHPQRKEVSGQAFNISNIKYETLRDICNALASSYGLKVEFAEPKPMGEVVPGMIEALLKYTQWVSSEKVRSITGWTERRPSFTQGIEEYRLAYEAALAAKHYGTVKINSTFQDPSDVVRQWNRTKGL
ncbi:putative NAD dependent epimerase/dehydratase [Talaromyces proteolyticus]|uniref:NAD dependent epimerase/dehydratase n=1 Tax=Talaromyces proteolyticus TaxID=1131652 RepID=A0AAD4KU06_9EURO|nr:putative NAD dependent epimerase/dehydratase [Talaromyces proteolyticus]KAH8699242.1 putative NAD dependent epimerase/dehydratase [Talaromyces proteolyticus]